METSRIVATIGLSIDVLGAFLMAKDYWSAPKKTEYEDVGTLDTMGQADRVQGQVRNYPFVRCGLILLVIGFVIQLIAQWV